MEEQKAVEIRIVVKPNRNFEVYIDGVRQYGVARFYMDLKDNIPEKSKGQVYGMERYAINALTVKGRPEISEQIPCYIPSSRTEGTARRDMT